MGFGPIGVLLPGSAAFATIVVDVRNVTYESAVVCRCEIMITADAVSPRLNSRRVTTGSSKWVSGYAHRPDDLAAEIVEDGRQPDDRVGVEGLPLAATEM
jgi:hypothetical protein